MDRLVSNRRRNRLAITGRVSRTGRGLLFLLLFRTSAAQADPVGDSGLRSPLGGRLRQEAAGNRVSYNRPEPSRHSLLVLSSHSGALQSLRRSVRQSVLWSRALLGGVVVGRGQRGGREVRGWDARC